MIHDKRARLKQWLESGHIQLHPLTFPQRELWETSPLAPEDCSNNIGALIRLRGQLTPKGCEAAFQKVVDRQEIFRLSFLPGKGSPMQLIRREARATLEFRELPLSQHRKESIEELAGEIVRRPFDLVRGPLYRAEIFRCASDDHVLVFSIHHALADGWTLGVFVQDLFAAYLQGIRNTASPLPPVALTYSEWGASERASWQPEVLEQRARFWKTELSGTSRLWKSSPRGSIQRHISQLSAKVANAVRELARRNGATLFSALLTVFQVSLSEWADVDDIVVGTPVANRGKKKMWETMGSCSCIVPIRGRVERNRTFSESLRSVHQITRDSFANTMPFAELMRAIGDAPSSGHNPVFQVRFALQNHPVPDLTMSGFSLQLSMLCTGTARFDVACEINEQGEELEIAFLYHTQLFSAPEIESLSRLYLKDLSTACGSPGKTSSSHANTLQCT